MLLCRAVFSAYCVLCSGSCDADPEALSKYVVALVKKDKPEEELKALCTCQLDVFLQDSEWWWYSGGRRGGVAFKSTVGSTDLYYSGGRRGAVAFKSTVGSIDLYYMDCSPRMTTLELTANTLFYCLHSLLPFPLCN